jgi:DNA-binding GntR family transcriptional regulator
VVERDLTSRLGVSRTPIREALQRLEKERLIVCYPHRGYYVRNPTLEEARQAYEMRKVIESACAELAAQRATADEIEAMRQAVARGDHLLRSNDFPNLLLANNEFHHLQARATHNEFLVEQWRVVWAYVDLLRGRFWMHTDRPSTGHVEHTAMIDAIAQRDPARARRLNEEHVERAWRAVAARFERETSAHTEPTGEA